ncbi:MAG: HAD family hydrolase [Corynebacterium glucuronolyticum]|nr:HAD family hydrolase [Corynebacterium glucuronolyticum]
MIIVTDVDGTLLDDSERVPADTFAALNKALAAGSRLVLATGRPPRWLSDVLSQLPVKPTCICANGAIIYDSEYDRMDAVHTLGPKEMRSIVRAAREAIPDVTIAVERAGNSAFNPESELFVVTPDYAPTWDTDAPGMEDDDKILRIPATKLLLRHSGMTSAQMARVLASRIPSDLGYVTYSVDEGLLEVSHPGITKATGIADLGLTPSEVIAFGDMPNDIEMLRWAGTGVAMPHAPQEVQDAADKVGTIPEVLERVL